MMASDQVDRLLAEALRGLVAFVEGRPEGASADEDVRALEAVAHVLQQAEPEGRRQLTNLLGPNMSEQIGLD